MKIILKLINICKTTLQNKSSFWNLKKFSIFIIHYLRVIIFFLLKIIISPRKILLIYGHFYLNFVKYLYKKKSNDSYLHIKQRSIKTHSSCSKKDYCIKSSKICM